MKYFFVFLSIILAGGSISFSENEKEISNKVPDMVFCLRIPGGDGHWYANFSHYVFDVDAKTYSTGGGALCRYHADTGKVSMLLEDPTGTFRDPVVHYDGDKILFSYRKGGEEFFHLYEIGIDGKNLRQITSGPYDDIEPCYLPDGKIIFVSSRCNRWVNCWVTRVAVLYRCDADGGNIEQLSANIEHDNTPVVLPNGQILYTRWEYIDRSQVHFHHLWMMNPDGTKQMVYFGNQTSSVPADCLLIDARPIPETNKVMTVFSWGHGAREHRGSLAVVSPDLGPDSKESLQFIYKGRSDFFDPFPLDKKRFIVSTGKAVCLGTLEQDEFMTVFEIPESYKRNNFMLFEPRPIVAVPRERAIPDNVDPGKTTGELLLIDVYEGRNMDGVEKGEVKHLLVLEALPKPINFTGGNEPLSYGGTFTLERIVGTVPVEPDGSAYMTLPQNRSFFFVALDEDMKSIQRMQSFTSVRGGEVTSCIGCHERREMAPVNKGKDRNVLALRKPPVSPRKIDSIPDVIDFPRDIQPILDKNCVRCHNASDRSGGINLTGDDGPVYSLSYFSLVGGLKISDGENYWHNLQGPREIGDTASRLIKLIEEGHHKVKLENREKKMIQFWINSGAAYPGTYSGLGSGMISGTFAHYGGARNVDNRRDNKMDKDERVKEASKIIKESCVECHPSLRPSICDEGALVWWCSRAQLKAGKISMESYQKELKYSRHSIYNLTHPEKSALLLAPLSKEAGGYGICERGGRPIIESKEDERYKKLLSAIEASKEELDRIGRFSRPGFIPNPAYTREMKNYGILPKEQPEGEPYDVYKTDREYWSSH